MMEMASLVTWFLVFFPQNRIDNLTWFWYLEIGSIIFGRPWPKVGVATHIIKK